MENLWGLVKFIFFLYRNEHLENYSLLSVLYNTFLFDMTKDYCLR